MKWVYRPVAAVLVAMSLAGCAPGGAGLAPVAQLPRQGPLRKIEKPKVSGDDRAWAGVNTVGLEILRRVAAESRGRNAIFSPISLSAALAVLGSGAAGDTRAEIDRLVNPEGLAAAALGEKYCNLINHLNRAGYSEDANRTTILEMANSIWIQDDLPVKSAFLEAANTWYGAEVFNVDLKSAGAGQAINRWIADRTHGRISGHVAQSPPGGVIYTFNSLYFRGKWMNEFDNSKTQKEDFYLGGDPGAAAGPAGGSGGSPGGGSGAGPGGAGTGGSPGGSPGVVGSGDRGREVRTVKVDMMNAERRIGYYEDAEAQAGKFDYYGCSMLVILPRGDLDEYLQRLDHARVESIIDGMESIKTKIKFPKFGFKRKTRLNDHLKAAGMNAAFDPMAADFTGIADRAEGFNLYVTDVSQECFISVDEEGTEAGALTSVLLAGAAAPKEVVPPEFYVNRPFLFLIRESRTGLVLFAGKVENPLEG